MSYDAWKLATPDDEEGLPEEEENCNACNEPFHPNYLVSLGIYTKRLQPHSRVCESCKIDLTNEILNHANRL